MTTRNKLIANALFASVIAVLGLQAEEVENYDSGKTRVVNIMSNQDTGVSAYNKQNVTYTQTQNLDKDLNVEAIASYFGCKTLMGHSFLAQTLNCPVSPEDKKATHVRRQQAIRKLVENPSLKKEVEEFLEQAKNHEQEVIQLMSEFFIGKTCPELKQLEELKKQHPWIYPFSKFMIMNPIPKTLTTFENNFIVMPGAIGLTGFYGYSAYLLSKMGSPFYKGTALMSGYVGLIAGFIGYENYKDYSHACEKRTKMHALHQLILIAEKIEKLNKQHGLNNQFNMSAVTDSNAQEIIEGLKSSRYKDKNCKVFLTSLVHTFLYKVYQQEKHLAQVFACIAEMDAYNAIATKMLASQNGNNEFCFATFIEDEKPIIKAIASWNVLVENAVASSLTEDKHIILTGPNAGGKTTTIRAILQNIILAQTFGVAAAQKFEVTMFDEIYSYLNISDDLINGLSLFKSEVKRAQEILEKVKTLASKKKFFFALDELFTGTVAEDGEKCAYEFIKRISEFDRVLFIYATHFHKLKELGKNNPRCINYKVDAPTKNSNGKLVYPFTLSQGANESNVALDIAKEANLFA